MKIRIILLTLILLAALRAAALDHSAAELHLPVVSNTNGANGTIWKTDLILASRHQSLPTIVLVIYTPVGGAEPQSMDVALLPRETVTLRDLIGDAFAMPGTYGTLSLSSLNPNVRIAAHARIYNAGNENGEFGQSFTALPIAQMSNYLWLHGLNGAGGNRTNVGIANPFLQTVTFSLAWYDKEGELHGSVGAISIPPGGLYLMNDIFNWTDQPYDEALTLRITSSQPVYAYASVVRNDTGDAYTIVADGSAP